MAGHAGARAVSCRMLAISGSLRSGSSNTAIVDASRDAAVPGVMVTVFDGLADIPPFNPDLDVDPFPAPVMQWRAALGASSAVLISSPEYAHGVPGVLKNALDWVVGSGEFMQKPVALVNASAFSSFVTGQLRETLSVMMADVVVATSLPLQGRPSSGADVLAQEDAARALREAMTTLAGAVATGDA
jgi:NAD(P)H-dependent FMN reductase